MAPCLGIALFYFCRGFCPLSQIRINAKLDGFRYPDLGSEAECFEEKFLCQLLACYKLILVIDRSARGGIAFGCIPVVRAKIRGVFDAADKGDDLAARCLAFDHKGVCSARGRVLGAVIIAPQSLHFV